MAGWAKRWPAIDPLVSSPAGVGSLRSSVTPTGPRRLPSRQAPARWLTDGLAGPTSRTGRERCTARAPPSAGWCLPRTAATGSSPVVGALGVDPYRSPAGDGVASGPSSDHRPGPSWMAQRRRTPIERIPVPSARAARLYVRAVFRRVIPSPRLGRRREPPASGEPSTTPGRMPTSVGTLRWPPNVLTRGSPSRGPAVPGSAPGGPFPPGPGRAVGAVGRRPVGQGAPRGRRPGWCALSPPGLVSRETSAAAWGARSPVWAKARNRRFRAFVGLWLCSVVSTAGRRRGRRRGRCRGGR
jgi:hypothetical protein